MIVELHAVRLGAEVEAQDPLPPQTQEEKRSATSEAWGPWLLLREVGDCASKTAK